MSLDHYLKTKGFVSGFEKEFKFGKATWETEPVLWRNAQWAVTEYGIENVAGPDHYDIPKFALNPSHPESEFISDRVTGKIWVVPELFNECLVKALEIHFGIRRNPWTS